MPESSDPRAFDRRAFLQLTAVAAAGVLAPAVVLAQVPPPSATTPAAPPGSPPEPSEDARSLTAILRRRFPDRLTDAQWESVARDFESDLGAGRRLRALALTNADEPDASFRA